MKTVHMSDQTFDLVKELLEGVASDGTASIEEDDDEKLDTLSDALDEFDAADH